MAKSSRNIKDILLSSGVVSTAIMNEALSEHEKRGGSLLAALFKIGKFNEQKLARIFHDEYKYTLVNPSIFTPESQIIALLPRETAEKYLALPISQHDGTLTVAFANPTDLKAIDEVKAISGMRIKPVVGQYSLIVKYIEKYYSTTKAAEEALAPAPAGQDDAAIDDLVKMIETEHEEDEATDNSSELMKVALETPVVKLVNMLLVEGIKRHASDIFIEPWENFVRVRIRVDGLLEEIIRPQKVLAQAIVSRIKIMSELDIAEHRIPQDGRFKVKVNSNEIDMRVSILPTTFGEKVCLRILDTSAQSHDIAKLGFSEEEQIIIKDSAKKPHGMILVTGPTGSGKTTTLYSVLKYLDAPDINITTVEDPVEYQIPGMNQVLVKDHIGLTFPAALRSILRQDPDVILIGEIRDNDTLDIAVKAALTGHLVLSTLHTNDAASSVTRMANMGLEPFLISSTVLMISAQRLVRRLCDKCKQPEEVESHILKKLEINIKEKPVFYKGKGCGKCRHTGYVGRSVITEILEMKQDIKDRIMQGETAENIKNYARTQGMQTLRDCAVRKALAGETSLEEVFRVTSEDMTSKEETDEFEDAA